ncbi:MAG: 50S ribosomal protein L23 [Planctomycetes bacterium]|nr:50S ribosomal protein L23 [Planctomycetota bacterium]
MKDPYGVILRPVLTEKTTGNIEHLNQYAFAVDPHANKIEIKRAVESIFNVRVLKVSTRWRRGKRRRIGRSVGFTSAWKEAIVHVGRGEKIDVY